MKRHGIAAPPTSTLQHTSVSCWLSSLRPLTSASAAALAGEDDEADGGEPLGLPAAVATRWRALGLRAPATAEPSCRSETATASEEELRVGVVPPRSLAAAAMAKAEEAYPVEVAPLPPPRPALHALLGPAAAPVPPAADPTGRLL